MLTAKQRETVAEMEKLVGDKLTEAEDAADSWTQLLNASAEQEAGAVKQARELYNNWTTGTLKQQLLRGTNSAGREYRLADWKDHGNEILALLNQELDLADEFDVSSALEHTATDTVALDYVQEKAKEAVKAVSEPWSFKTKAAVAGAAGLLTLVTLAWSAKQLRLAGEVVGIG